MEQFFKELFEYNHHFNQKLIGVFISESENISDKSKNLFSHILNAHQIWNCRIGQKEKPFEVWQLHNETGLGAIDLFNYENTIKIIDTHPLTQLLDYSNSKGQSFKNSIKDILFHVINHSTYHRGQIASEFKQSGIEPLITDYIFYKR